MQIFKLFSVAVLGWGLASTIAEAAPLRVAIEGDGAYAPFSFFKADKTLTGFDIELTNALCQHIPEGCDIIPVNFEVIVDGLANGTYDVSISSLGWTKERAAKILYGPAYYRSHDAFIGRPEKFTDISPGALKTVRLASSQGTTQQKYLTEHYPNSVILQSKRGADFAYVGEPLKSDDITNAAYIGLRKGLEAKADEFSAALKQIRLDGTYDRINRQFVPFNIY